MKANEEHTRFVCDVCGKAIDESELHDIGDGRDLCGECFGLEVTTTGEWLETT